MIRSHDSIIVQTLGRFLIPVVQIFGLYVLFFGAIRTGGRLCGWGDSRHGDDLIGFDFWS